MRSAWAIKRAGQRWAASVGLGLCVVTSSALADFSIPGYELVYTAPVETALQAPDLRAPDAVWSALFDEAQQRLSLGEFYVANQRGSRLDNVLQHLRSAGERGVRIRFLLEEKGIVLSTPETLAQLKAIPNLELRVIPYAKLTGGILHAKYLLVDGKRAYVGSQNFDWRSLEHIHETGLLIDDPSVLKQLNAVFEQDWQAQEALVQGIAVKPVIQTVVQDDSRPDNYLVASPKAFNPPGVLDSEAELPRLLGQAKTRVRIQVMDYAPLSYGPNRTRPYYAVIDNALRSAAARGVKVELMVANWSTKKPNIAYLKSLAVLPNVEVKIVTLPEASNGFIPFARVIHSKVMTIDQQKSWVGTSNWSGGYLDNSRNLEIVMQSPAMTARIDALYAQLWNSEYAQPIQGDKDYPAPRPGGGH
ncbi:phospholipase [Symbiopectobacterium purcellii]|uniref:Phospholipase n=1 Tax=Symbiopectobacterium purcellii TaxID=2871826 RepID=A0ABX9AKB8_9ENTR|nr:phospholipase D-like domain-containing protein [Symbiopectobacterium purcellii]QZN95605.1 phospholipase [Symbiopectobacterium purcellii]